MVRATPEATTRFAARHPSSDFYRPGWGGLTLASIGLGTYLVEENMQLMRISPMSVDDHQALFG